MSDVIIFVDDLCERDNYYVTGRIARAMRRIGESKGQEIKTVEISGENVLLRDSLPLVKQAIKRNVDSLQDVLVGICVDLVDDSDRPREKFKGRFIHSGEVLLERIKEDDEVKDITVLIYTGRYVDDAYDRALIEKGAVALVRREDERRADKTVDELMAEQILRILRW